MKKSQKRLCAIDPKSIGIYQMVLWFGFIGLDSNYNVNN